MITLASYLGGSRLYELNGPNSDLDQREIVLNDEPSKILGLERFDQSTTNTKTEDKIIWELRHFLSLLKDGNFQGVEPLWAESDKFTYLDERFKVVRALKQHLTNSDGLFIKVNGFVTSHSHKIFEIGKKSDKDGDRTREVQQFGFDPKGASTIIRAAESAGVYFETGNYDPVPRLNKQLCLDLKYAPENFSVDGVRKLTETAVTTFRESYGSTQVKHVFNDGLANDLLMSVYLPLLNKP